MTLTADSPAALRAPRSSERPPRRARRWIIAGSVMLTLLALLVAGYAAVPQLARLGTTGAPEYQDGTVVTLPSYGEHGTDVLAYEHGARVTLSVPVSNAGVLPVTITDARLTDEPRPLLETTKALAVDAELPVILWPGQSTRLHLEGRFDNCRYYHEREAQLMPALLLDVETAGRSFTEAAGFEHELVVRSPMIIDCPDRTLSRDDDVRR